MTAKIIVAFLWGALEALLIYMACTIPIKNNDASSLIAVGLIVSTICLVAIFGYWVYTHWSDQE